MQNKMWQVLKYMALYRAQQKRSEGKLVEDISLLWECSEPIQ